MYMRWTKARLLAMLPVERLRAAVLALALLFATGASADAPIVRYGGDRNFAPFEFVDDRGQPQGFQVELLQELARTAGLQAEIRLDDWQVVEAAFREGKLDLIAMSRTRRRGEWANFLRAHATPALAIFHHSNDRAPESLQDLEGPRIAYLDSEPMRETMSDFFSGDRFRFTPHATPRAALESVRDGSSDVALMLRAYGDPLLESKDLHDVVAAEFSVRLQGYAFATQPADAALAERLSRALEALDRSGILESLRVKWLSSHRGARARAQLQERIVQQWVAGGAMALVALALLFVLGRKLGARTRAMRAERQRREAAEQALRTAEQRFEQTFAMHPDGMVILQAGTGVILEANQAMGRLLGLACDAVVGQAVEALAAIDSPLALATLRAMLHEAGSLDAVPLQLRRSDGELRDCLVHSEYFDLDSRRCAFTIVRDVSDQTRQQAQFRKSYDTLLGQMREQAKKLGAAQESVQEARRESARFTTTIAHDLQAPVRAIRGVSVFLKHDISSGALASALANVDRIDRAALRMDALIGSLTRLSRAEAAELLDERIDMSAVARETWDMLAADPARSVTFTLAPLPPATGDAQLVLQVWQNLLGNAYKYTGRSATPAVGVDSFVEGGRTWYRVTDNGAGFDMSHSDGLFQPFRRMHSEREFPGTGIGLSIVQRIVQRHGGEIRARSNVGVGSIFEFTLQAGTSGVTQAS